MVEPFYALLGRRIQLQRNARRMTQAELGLRLEPKMTRASVANIETGKQRVLVHTLLALTRALQCELSDLLPADEATRQAKTSRELAAELQDKLGFDEKGAVKLASKIEKTRREKS